MDPNPLHRGAALQPCTGACVDGTGRAQKGPAPDLGLPLPWPRPQAFPPLGPLSPPRPCFYWKVSSRCLREPAMVPTH